MRLRLLFLVAVLAAAVATPVATAATRDRLPVTRSAHSSKLESRLGDVVQAQRTNGRGGAVARARGLDVIQGRVRVVVEARASTAAAREAVTTAGGEVESTYADLVQALVAPGALEALARASAVEYLRPPHKPFADATTGEEIAASGADVFQGALWSGAGVKVGIIDLGFGGLAARQAAGDLPAVTTVDFCPGAYNVEVHGVGVAEIVHEVAPGAQLYLICIDSEVTLGQAKEYAKANGITIVNHSVGWFNVGRGDGSGGPGSVNGIVADARANGILWVNSGGNYQQRHWGGGYVGGGGGFVNAQDFSFGGGDGTNDVLIGGGATGCFTLKWDSWPTTDIDDFDLYLLNNPDLNQFPANVVAFSENFQNPDNLPPTEEFCYTNPGATTTFYLVVLQFSGDTAAFDLFTLGTTGGLQYQVAERSLVEPASSPNTMAVGALCWADGTLRSYSSLGPTIDGRTKPDIAGLDGVSGGTYGGSSGCTGGFTGTSAAAPHVAGLAALGKEQNPSLTAAQLQTWLEARARDIATPGKDNTTGSGRAYVQTFTDASPWGTLLQNYIEQLFRKGTTTGCTTLDPATGVRNYCPDEPVSRLAMAIFLVRSMNLTELFPPAATFDDVPVGSFGRGFVERLYEQGVTTGCAVGPPALYCPSNPVSRLAMAIFIVRAKAWTELFPPIATFDDMPVGSFGRGFVERFYAEGVTTGCAVAPLRYCPFNVVDRKAMAAFLIRAFGPPTP